MTAQTTNVAKTDDIWLELEDVSMRYDASQVIKKCSFAMQKGEILSLLGASGCGKSTLLKGIAGLMPICNGNMKLQKNTIADENFCMIPQLRQVGMIFQDYALFPHLSVAQNIAFALKNKDKKQRAARVAEMLELVRLSAYGNRYPHEISGGQQQRVAIARALAREPQLLLLDEPFSNLDNEVRRRLIGEIRDLLHEREMTAIFVTHNKAEAFALSDRVAVMNDGQIEQIGTPQQLYDKPKNAYIADFLGQGITISGERIATGWRTIAGDIDDAQVEKLAHFHKDEQNIKIYLRPHQIRLISTQLSDKQANVRVVDSNFLGDFSIYDIETASADGVISVLSQGRFQLGEWVVLRLII